MLAQTSGDWELLVLDDGSTDATRELVQGYRDPRIRFFARPHRGIAPSRNEAMALAASPLVAFLDSDDAWAPEKLERQVAFFRRASSDIAVLYTGGLFVDDQGRTRRVLAPPPTGRGMIFDRLLYTHWILFSSVMVRREAVEALGGFNETLVSGSDREWLLRMARRFAFDFLPEPLVQYRLHRGSSMMSDLRARIVLTETILSQYADDLGRRPRLLAHKYLSLARLHLNLGETQRARQAMRQAIAASPGFLSAYLHLASSYGGWAAWRRLSRARRDLGEWWDSRGRRREGA